LISTPGHRWTELQKQLQGSFASCLVKPLIRTSHLISGLSAAVRMREQPAQPIPISAPAAPNTLPRVAAVAPSASSAPIASSTPKLAPEPAPASPRTETRSPVPAKYRVLIAEDNPTNQLLARRLLEDLGCRVDLAVNGREAVDLARQTTYDIIFMDCHMPEMDGFRATETIRRDEEAGRAPGANRQTTRRLPIVALTASAFEEDRQRARDAGMDGFIAKPVTKLELRRALTTWVECQDNVSM
jgi:CheY-like chemotaxis protein